MYFFLSVRTRGYRAAGRELLIKLHPLFRNGDAYADACVNNSTTPTTKSTIIFIMDGERKINLSEGVPLNSTGAANIFLNTGKGPRTNTQDGTVIQLKTGTFSYHTIL